MYKNLELNLHITVMYKFFSI